MGIHHAVRTESVGGSVNSEVLRRKSLPWSFLEDHERTCTPSGEAADGAEEIPYADYPELSKLPSPKIGLAPRDEFSQLGHLRSQLSCTDFPSHATL